MAKTDLPNLTILPDEARRSPVRVSLELSGDERVVLAERFGLDSVETFRMKAKAVGVKGRKLRVDGDLQADITYICGVSLKPYPAHLDVPFVQFFGEETPGGDTIDLDPLDDSDIEPLTDGVASLSDLAYQLFSLSLTPYPRHPDLAPPEETSQTDGDAASDDDSSPFAVLKSLKG